MILVTQDASDSLPVHQHGSGAPGNPEAHHLGGTEKAHHLG